MRNMRVIFILAFAAVVYGRYRESLLAEKLLAAIYKMEHEMEVGVTKTSAEIKTAYEEIFNESNYPYSKFKSKWNSRFSSNKIGSSTSETSLKLIARFWAHMSQETGTGSYKRESGCGTGAPSEHCCHYQCYDGASDHCDDYADDNSVTVPDNEDDAEDTCTGYSDSDKVYYGRGSLQLSWDYNYKKYGSDVGVDFMDNADKVASNSGYRIDSGLWYFKQSYMHKCDTGETDMECFARSIMKINGAIECSSANQSGQTGRFGYLKTAYDKLGLTALSDSDRVDCYTYCKDNNSAGAQDGAGCYWP